VSAGHGHGHGGASLSASGRHRGRLVAAAALIGTFFVVELVAGLLTRSLALLSDAGHMAADVVTLVAALVATHVAARPDGTGRRTYGSYRAEVMASGLAVLVMLGVAAYVGWEAVGRLGDPSAPAAAGMVVVGALGLAVNLVALGLLRQGSRESLNLKGAYQEVVADTVGSVGVLVAGLLVAATGAGVWDTAVALAISVFVVVRALRLGREVLAVLGQHAPAGVEPTEVADELAALEGVADVHDLHVWQLTSGMDVATAHLVTTTGATTHDVLDRARHTLQTRFGIAHATLQVEPADHTGCDEIAW
jgi:cobalt-zinc-cadmium efflux system protein